MKRIIKIAFITLIILCTMWCQSTAKGKKVKVYMDLHDHGYNESFSFHLMEHMRLVDEDDKSYEFEWVKRATDAEFIMTFMVDKNKLPVMVRGHNGSYNSCYQFIAVVHLWKKGSGKTHEMLNLQMNCDLDGIAEQAVKAMEVAMGLKTENYAVQKQ
jgi:hypothetical protein